MTIQLFYYKCARCGSEWESKVSNLNGCKFCHALLSLRAKRRKVEYTKRYLRQHLEMVLAVRHRRRARIAGSDGHFTVKEFKNLCETYENKCAYCGQKLSLGPDHVVPLSWGGSNNISNIVPACSLCNTRKGTMTPSDFLQCFGQELAEEKRVRVYMEQHPNVVEAVRQKYFPQAFL